jgi:hypothetical protein
MKKKLVSALLSFGLALSLLVGCGSSSSTTSTSASNVEGTQTNESQETSTIAEEESSTQEEVEGDIVFYDEPRDFGYTSDDEFKEVTNYEITSTDDDITLYDTTWKQVGHLKEGVSVTVVGESTSTYKVINPVEGTDYDYFYIDKSCVPTHGVASNMYTVDEFMEAFEEQLKICYEEDDNASKVETTIVDSPDNLEKGSKYATSLFKEYLNSDDETANLHGIAKHFYDKYSEIYIISASNEFDYDTIEIDFKCNLK